MVQWKKCLARLHEEHAFVCYLLAMLASWCVVHSVTRLAMFLSSAGVVSWQIGDVAKVFGLGALYDASAGVFFCLPVALYLLVPQHFVSARVHRVGLAALSFVLDASSCSARSRSTSTGRSSTRISISSRSITSFTRRK